jgi:DNA-binding NtrC family response regulator
VNLLIQNSGCELLPDNSDYPTILVVHCDGDFRDSLVRTLKQKGYLILEAQDATKASQMVIRHSRHIHLLVADDSDDSRAVATTLKPYRPDMQVLHISSNREISSVLIEVSKVLDPPPKQKKRRRK